MMSRNVCVLVRQFSVEAVKITRNDASAMPFDKIPGPKGFLGIGNFYNYFKISGKYKIDRLYENSVKRYEEYGPIVCERIVPGLSVLWLFDPNDIAEVYREEPGDYASRRSHMALEKYRKDRPDIYRTGGLLPTNGEEWWKLRSELQKGLSSPKNVRNFLPLSDEIVTDFVNALPRQFDQNNQIAEMLNELNLLNLELLCKLVFDQRMNSFSNDQRHPESIVSQLINASEISNDTVLLTDQDFHLWRWFQTPDYKKLRQSQEFMERFAIEMVDKKMKQTGDGNSLLEQYLNNPKLDVKDLYGMACDLLLAGVHTTSYTLSFALHYISSDHRVQDLIYAEALKILPNDGNRVTPTIMNTEIPYTRAVLKEVLRLNPVSIGVGRNLNRDKVLSGHHVPKDTITVTNNMILCRLEKYFPDPLKFLPERWLRPGKERVTGMHPFLVLPFGHGMRSCIARRFAEQNMLVTILRLVRSYKMEWHGTEKHLDVVTKLINAPKDKITMKFEKR